MIDMARLVADSLLGIKNADNVLAQITDGKGNLVKGFFDGSLGSYQRIEDVGTLFEKSLKQIERKNAGQFYTPTDIVQYIINSLPIKSDSKILDPTCGCGSFLLGMFDFLKNKYGVSALRNLFGVDLNTNAVNITRFGLFIKSGYNKSYLKTLIKNIRVGNSIVSNKALDSRSFDWQENFSSVMGEGGFDFIVGNPPYITLRADEFDSSEQNYSKIMNGPVNAASLMIVRSLDLLKRNGKLAFLLPKSLLYVHSYDLLRKFILANSKILQIFDLGQKFPDVRGEQIILILQKKKPRVNQNDILIRILRDYKIPLRKQPSVKINQQLLCTLNNFLALDNINCYKIIKELVRKSSCLGELVDGRIFRGLPIGANSAYISKTPSHKSHEVLRGGSIQKFKIKDKLYLKSANLALDDNKIDAMKEKKIVLQNIFSSEAGTIAAFDDNGIMTLDTVTNVIVENDSMAKYLLGLLNSKLINFYIMYGLFDRSRLTMHMDKSYLASIPLEQNPDKTIKRKITHLVTKAIKENDLPQIKKINKQIDQNVFDLYGINKKQAFIIETAVNGLLSEKSRW